MKKGEDSWLTVFPTRGNRREEKEKTGKTGQSGRHQEVFRVRK